MQLICGNVAALSVAIIFYTWRAYHEISGLRQRRLRERVAYMLWSMAQRVGSPFETVAAE